MCGRRRRRESRWLESYFCTRRRNARSTTAPQFLRSVCATCAGHGCRVVYAHDMHAATLACTSCVKRILRDMNCRACVCACWQMCSHTANNKVLAMSITRCEQRACVQQANNVLGQLQVQHISVLHRRMHVAVYAVSLRKQTRTHRCANHSYTTPNTQRRSARRQN